MTEIRVTVLLSMIAFPGRAQGQETVVATFPIILKGKPDRKIIERIERILIQDAAGDERLRVVAGAQLRQRLGKKPRVAIKSCGSDLSCLAGLGERVAASEIILAQATSRRRRVVLTVVVVNILSQEIDRRLSFTFASVSDVDIQLRERFDELFGLPPVTESDDVAKLAVVEEPYEERYEGSAPLAALAPDPEGIADRGRGRGWPNGPEWMWSGIGGTALGAVAFGAAVFFGSDSRSTRDSIRRNGSMTQLEAIRINQQANRLATRSNVSLMVGSGLVMAGGGLLAAVFLLGP